MKAILSNPAVVYVPRRGFSLSTSIVIGLVACLDCVVLFSCGVMVYLLYPGWSIEKYPEYLSVVAINTLLTSLLFYFVHLYKIGSLMDRRKQLLKVILCCLAAFMVLAAAAFALKISTEFSRVWIFYWFLSSVCVIYICRMLVRRLLLSWAKTGRLTRNIAIVGAGEQGHLLLERLKKQARPWMRIVGVFDDRSDRVVESADSSNLMAGNINTLLAMARKERIDDILVALPWGAEERLLSILNKLQILPANVRLSPDTVGFKFPYRGYSSYSGIPTLNISDKPLSGWDYVVKEVEDKILGTLLLILLIPIILVIAVLIKLDSPGPVFFRQNRYGFNNQLIRMLKFRTMYIDQQDENAVKLTTKDDPRVTKLGRFLRRTSLDELPQFFNVFTGEMSIVGPRPHATQAKAAGKLYENVVYQYAARHKVKPGITGWAQVNGWRGDTDTEEKIQKRVEHDIEYINHWSLLLDLKIIFKTVSVVLSGQNAY
jgi:Undecaprenyl-phosphate glucose phosphotransferase